MLRTLNSIEYGMQVWNNTGDLAQAREAYNKKLISKNISPRFGVKVRRLADEVSIDHLEQFAHLLELCWTQYTNDSDGTSTSRPLTTESLKIAVCHKLRDLRELEPTSNILNELFRSHGCE
jgi:hypothetical protein